MNINKKECTELDCDNLIPSKDDWCKYCYIKTTYEEINKKTDRKIRPMNENMALISLNEK
tara:strand:- start:8472 stop:8651 length:180 start_codon:yes stop_codon:yes gene_type:complete